MIINNVIKELSPYLHLHDDDITFAYNIPQNIA